MELIENMDRRRGEVLKVGICSKCKVIYKLRSGEEPPDGVHRCRECGAVIELGGGKMPLRFSGVGN